MAHNILNFSINIFPKDSPKLESFPNCGRVGNPNTTECIWDCEWVNNPKLNQPVNTGVIQLDALFPPGYRYNLIKYPETLSWIEDCRILYRMRQITSWPEIRQLVEDVTRWNPNLDNIIFEVCALYFELNGCVQYVQLVIVATISAGLPCSRPLPPIRFLSRMHTAITSAKALKEH